MSQSVGEDTRRILENVYHSESRWVLATLIRLLGDFDLAEEVLHDAFAAALEQWPKSGLPDNPRAWLVSAGRFKAKNTGALKLATPTERESALTRVFDAPPSLVFDALAEPELVKRWWRG